MPTRKTSAPKTKPGALNKPAPATKAGHTHPSKAQPGSSKKTSNGTKKHPPEPKPVPPPSPKGKIVVYRVRDSTTTMRSAHGSWFIGTLSKGDHFYHYYSDPTRDGKWIWGYTPHRYGCLHGLGWVSVDDLEMLDQKPPNLDDSIHRDLQAPKRLMGIEFTSRYADDSHLPTDKSDQAEWKVTIKKGVTVPFYINQRDGHPVPSQLHPAKPQLTSADDGEKLKVRYLVKEHPNLMVADFAGKGHWGFILKQGDNFTVDFKQTRQL